MSLAGQAHQVLTWDNELVGKFGARCGPDHAPHVVKPGDTTTREQPLATEGHDTWIP